MSLFIVVHKKPSKDNNDDLATNNSHSNSYSVCDC